MRYPQSIPPELPNGATEHRLGVPLVAGRAKWNIRARAIEVSRPRPRNGPPETRSPASFPWSRAPVRVIREQKQRFGPVRQTSNRADPIGPLADVQCGRASARGARVRPLRAVRDIELPVSGTKAEVLAHSASPAGVSVTLSSNYEVRKKRGLFSTSSSRLPSPVLRLHPPPLPSPLPPPCDNPAMRGRPAEETRRTARRAGARGRRGEAVISRRSFPGARFPERGEGDTVATLVGTHLPRALMYHDVHRPRERGRTAGRGRGERESRARRGRAGVGWGGGAGIWTCALHRRENQERNFSSLLHYRTWWPRCRFLGAMRLCPSRSPYVPSLSLSLSLFTRSLVLPLPPILV
jgi:hypothetical protein